MSPLPLRLKILRIIFGIPTFKILPARTKHFALAITRQIYF